MLTNVFFFNFTTRPIQRPFVWDYACEPVTET